MQDYEHFHDGAFQGLLIDDKTIQIFLSTDEKERFVLVVEEVAALIVNGIQLGNIILDIEERATEDLTIRDIYDVFEYGKVPNGEIHAEKALLMARKEGLCLLAINPSCGGSCLVLGKAMRLFRRGDAPFLLLQ